MVKINSRNSNSCFFSRRRDQSKPYEWTVSAPSHLAKPVILSKGLVSSNSDGLLFLHGRYTKDAGSNTLPYHRLFFLSQLFYDILLFTFSLKDLKLTNDVKSTIHSRWTFLHNEGLDSYI